MLKFYTIKGGGRLTSCVGICLWLLEEIGVSYEIVDVDIYGSEHRSEEFLKLNSDKKIFCLPEGTYLKQSAGKLIFDGIAQGVWMERGKGQMIKRFINPGDILNSELFT